MSSSEREFVVTGRPDGSRTLSRNCYGQTVEDRQARDRKIIALRRSGMTLSAIESIVGITRERVQQICKAEGLPPKRCVPKIVTTKDGARTCRTCGARAQTTKTIMLCQRTGRLPGGK